MYLPQHFREEDPEKLRELMAAFPLAALISAGPGGLAANHVPLLFEAEPAPLGRLCGHLARANPQWKDFPGEAMAIFQGPQAYISPNWYPTKQVAGRVVPTWNYGVVHVWGRVTVHSEPEWLRGFLDRLTATHEASQPKPWAPSDAPTDYIDGLIKGVVGIEIAITRIEGKWKVSQNQPEANRAGAAEGLLTQGGDASLQMASLIHKL
jgi:transcriptional regulator